MCTQFYVNAPPLSALFVFANCLSQHLSSRYYNHSHTRCVAGKEIIQYYKPWRPQTIKPSQNIPQPFSFLRIFSTSPMPYNHEAYAYPSVLQTVTDVTDVVDVVDVVDVIVVI